MERRTALRIIALGAMDPKLDALGAATHCSMQEGTAWTPADYKLQFFTPAENELVDQLAEIIIPADDHSPGAHAARVSLFADLMVATSNDAVKEQWRHGLRVFRETVAKSSAADAIAQAAAHEARPTTDLELFFIVLKQMIVNGYYTSEIGIHKDLEYIGNTYVAEFPGYPPLT
jgi:gluconate 2-dehydrogenase gamma chain